MSSLLDKAVDISTTIKRNGGRIAKPRPKQQETAVVPPVNIPVYNAKADMERMQNIDLSQATNSKLPPAILQEMIQNPINVAVPEEISDFDKVMGTDMTRMERSLEIQRRMESMDVKPPKRGSSQGYSLSESEDDIPTSGYSVVNRAPQAQVDYNMIRMIIEKVIDDRLDKLQKIALNESRQTNQIPKMALMALGDKFTFVDSDNNIYEGTIVFKGRRKPKNRQQ